MKKLIIFFLILYLLFPVLSFSEDEPTICLMDMSQFPQDTIPNYLQPWWNNVRIGKFAVVYVDFPDGRWNDNGELKQPFTNEQLILVSNLDAAGEMGLVLEPTNIQSGTKYVKASKYNWYDRWNMFFDSLGVYYGTAHPDNVSNGDTAYGSFKQYWKEASNGKFEVIPYVTHPNETNYKLKTGIVNEYQLINGVPVIKCLKLPKKKYGTDDTNSYFRNYNDYNFTTAGKMTADAIAAINNQINPDNFDLQQFLNDKGILFVYFAGSHRSFKDETNHSQISPIRLREFPITDDRSKIDGFGVSAHQYGHLQFLWTHTNSGRCDIMNGGDVHDNNSPQFPNPIYRLQQGWIQPIALESTQIDTLLPVETSYRCGVVTIYGKPSAAPDWSAGESYFIENRRRLSFDRSLLDEFTSTQFPNFKGGLLVWHYTPYKLYVDPYGIGGGSIRLRTADTVRNLSQNTGHPESFFAYDQLAPSQFKNFDSSRTYSGTNTKTGIELRTIEQINYSDLNSSIKFNLNYLISEPQVYDYVIYPRGGNERKITLFNNVFYHGFDNKEYYKVLPGAIIDFISLMSFKNMDARGDVNNFITFRGPGYSNGIESHKSLNAGLKIEKLSAGAGVDSCFFENVNIENTETGKTEIFCLQNTPFPISLKNINVTVNSNNRDDFDVKFTGSYINEINLSSLNIAFIGITYFEGDVFINSSRVYFHGEKRFAAGKNFIFANSTLDNLTFGTYTDVTFDKIASDTNWQGLRLDGGGITLDKGAANYPKIRNAITGIDISGATEKVSIRNTKFENNRDYDISIYKISEETIEKPRISKSSFSQDNTTNVKIASILLSECPNIGIDSNTITNTGYFGIILLNNESPLINSNSISGGNINGTHSSGIFSYNSNGYYKCNSIYQCTNYGILLDNSQPVLFNNVIGVNGIGLHLTNNSNPVLMPGYLNNETYVMGGYNFIHHNASEEIYCKNSKFNSSIPVMYKGNNGIVDENPNFNDILIYNEEVSGIAPTIDCPDNYWGGDSPSGRLFPDYSFLYDSYLTSILSYPCDFISESADNESEPSEYLLLGNALKNQYQENYNTALNYSNQLLALSNSNINPVISLNNLFTSTFFSNRNFTDLENYYLTLAAQNSSDTILSNASRNLAIESKIERNEIEPAILDYENIIFTSSDEELRFYASINRSRAIRLLLDSLLTHTGDNMSSYMDLESLYDKAIKYNANGNSYLKKSNENAREKNMVQKENTGAINSANQIKINENHFPFLQKRVSDKIKNFNTLNENEKRSLIIEKNILDLAENSYIDGIASLDDKLKFLNQRSNLALRQFKLYQNYPNPFNPSTTISFELPKSGLVKLKIYDLLGREVSVLINEFKESGVYETEFNGANFSSGIYFYKIETGDFVQVKRMALIK